MEAVIAVFCKLFINNYFGAVDNLVAMGAVVAMGAMVMFSSFFLRIEYSY